MANNIVKRRTQLEGDKESKPPTISDMHGSTSTDKEEPQPGKGTVAATIFAPAIWTSLLLIFGGCCSNVYALESILKLSPATGTLVTFLQFLLTALYTLPSQLTFTRSAGSATTSFIPRLRQRIIPIHKWLIYTAFFLTINILNNGVFNYKISIPLHIILRSASPLTSMMVGYIMAGRRYSSRQIFAVLLLFAGVVLAALSDAQTKSDRSKGNVPIAAGENREGYSTLAMVKAALTDADIVNQLPGFIYLFSALILSAVMGIYTDKIYDEHGRSIEVTDENLFYSHTLSLPWFALQRAKLNVEYADLMDKAVIANPPSLASTVVQRLLIRVPKAYILMPSFVRYLLEPSTLAVASLLLVNALTQIGCITGVNRLSTETTSLTVTIVLNVRKLVSLLLSIWLFGNDLSLGVAVGAVLVFVGGGLYGFGGSQKKSTPKKQKVK